MNYEEITKRINSEMNEIQTRMRKVLDKNKSKTEFVKEMYNNFNIICL